MKQQSLSASANQSTAVDLLLNDGSVSDDHKKDAGDLDKVVKSFKTGFGSIMGIFKDKEEKTPGGQKLSVNKSMQPNSRMTNSMNVSIDSNQRMGSGVPVTGQLEYQISYAFFQNFQRYEDLNQYLINVGRILMGERDKIAQLFKRV